MITLAIETSTGNGSLALSEDGRILLSERFMADRGHGAGLFASLERARDIVPHWDQIVVGLGPGSYSGVRIAIAAAVGLEFATKAKMIGMPSILALETTARKYSFVGDARRDTFYFAVIDDGECVSGPMLLDSAELKAALKEHENLPVLTSASIDEFPDLQICFPSAERLARLAEMVRGISARDNLEPIYLRDPHITQPKKL
ncbi:MAG: tRNA (adenosine(37)-N6)-threonylcarbamoyltransferase complex dimerization subunit type 1 TsaB [Chthoniobacteraceae bacterium]